MATPSKTSITPTDIIHALSQAVLSKCKKTIHSFVFDPEEMYERAITAGRVEQFYREPIDLDQKKIFEDRKLLPMLAWNRTNLIPSALNGRPNRLYCDVHGNTDFSTALCEFTFNFTYYSTNMIELEQFELDWNLQLGLRKIATIKIYTSKEDSIPPFEYSIIWENELQSINFSLDQNYYKSLTGSGKISGSFASFINLPEDQLPTIKEIRFSVYDCDGNEIIYDSFKPITELLKNAKD